MDDDLLKIAIPALLGLLAFGTLAMSLVFNVSGVWERVPDDSTPRNGPPERVTLGQLGPFVRGRREIPGGWQEYSGTIWFRTVTLTRRDFGVDALVRQNFPEVLAKKLSGDVFAELKLDLVEAGTQLQGSFKPQKVEFLLAPPRITQRYWMPEVPRTYRRVSPVEAEEEEEGTALVKDVEPA